MVLTEGQNRSLSKMCCKPKRDKLEFRTYFKMYYFSSEFYGLKPEENWTKRWNRLKVITPLKEGFLRAYSHNESSPFRFLWYGPKTQCIFFGLVRFLLSLQLLQETQDLTTKPHVCKDGSITRRSWCSSPCVSYKYKQNLEHQRLLTQLWFYEEI